MPGEPLPPEQVREGDCVLLEEGDRVAADARISEAVGLALDESLLTGESMPVQKGGQETIMAGSLVVAGRGRAAVVVVGEATELGRLGRSLATLKPPATRLQRRTRRMTRRVTLVALGLCLLLALLLGARSGQWPDALLAALALALAQAAAWAGARLSPTPPAVASRSRPRPAHPTSSPGRW
ncbi:hypothetical protein NZK32_09425 [Cyanobium sp. FGCU-52]|nr:hypothetical protein [Cyanobium sp. FGCU52]